MREQKRTIKSPPKSMRLDRPELREKVKGILENYHTYLSDIETHSPSQSRGISEAEAIKQTLALFPDEKLLIESLREIITSLEAKVEEGQHKLCEVCEHVAIEEAEKQERESRASIFGYIEDMFPELRQGYWNTKGWIEFKNEQLASPQRY